MDASSRCLARSISLDRRASLMPTPAASSATDNTRKLSDSR